jgi:hypothetical protein
MNTEFDELVRDAMRWFAIGLEVPADLAGKARRGLRRRRQLAGGAAAAACAVLGLAAALIFAAGSSAGPVHVHLAAWSVNTNPDGTVTFKLRKISQPARLQHTLAEAGVPAMVRWGEICLAQGRHALLDTEGFVKITSGDNTPAGKEQPTAFFAQLGGQKDNWGMGGWSWTITPAKIPPGGQFVISAVPPGSVPPNDIQAVWEFVHSSAHVTCARLMQP